MGPAPRSFYRVMHQVVQNRGDRVGDLARDIYYGTYFYQCDPALDDPGGHAPEGHVQMREAGRQMGEDHLFVLLARVFGAAYLDEEFPQRLYHSVRFMVGQLDAAIGPQDGGLSFCEKAVTNLIYKAAPEERDAFADFPELAQKLTYFRKYVQFRDPGHRDISDLAASCPPPAEKAARRFAGDWGLHRHYHSVRYLLCGVVERGGVDIAAIPFVRAHQGAGGVHPGRRPARPPPGQAQGGAPHGRGPARAVDGGRGGHGRILLKGARSEAPARERGPRARALSGMDRVEEYAPDRYTGRVAVRTTYRPRRPQRPFRLVVASNSYESERSVLFRRDEHGFVRMVVDV